MTGGIEIPKPYVVAARADGTDLVASVTLFGLAADWAGSVADALVRGLRQGINEADADRARYRSLEVIDRTIAVGTGPEPFTPDSGTILLVTLETPLSIRSGDTIRSPDFGDLVSSLTSRVQGLARWHDAALTADWPDLIRQGRTLPRHDIARTAPLLWQRGSTRQDRAFRVGGGRGQWLVDTPSPDLMALLLLGQTTGAGGRTTLGLGRFRIDLVSEPT
ncbi:CRISPR system precrRNA processing endoribonuclease RAMP protein Cas6 [Phaeospirillum tilakii]|uniref:CRISPR system precrRNA processing endoribonuclease RAMP protein Cas6 n=1 Tax=Phaeospirillum tilakii TaxID=741673 RepID=A0ABW5CAU9_9PROT